MIRSSCGVLAAMVLLCAAAEPVTAEAARPPVLGAKAFAPNGFGFGTVKPKSISNGGDLSGLVVKIRWRGWGGEAARGRGLGNQFRPGGGYFRKRVKVRFRATRLGKCGHSGPLAYRVLMTRMQTRPGGEFGNWFPWSGRRTVCRW